MGAAQPCWQSSHHVRAACVHMQQKLLTDPAHHTEQISMTSGSAGMHVNAGQLFDKHFGSAPPQSNGHGQICKSRHAAAKLATMYADTA